MKKIFIVATLLILASNNINAKDLAPFIKVGTTSTSIDNVSESIQNALKDKSFIVLGDYNPENNKNIKVIAFTRADLKNTVVKVKDRGALAGVLKIALVTKNGITTISYTNPDYMFNAYLRDDVAKYGGILNKISADLKDALTPFTNNLAAFGGSVDENKLKNYHYKIMMPYFTDPVELKEFGSFEEGVKVIDANLARKKGQTQLIYKLVYPAEKIVVYGIGLGNTATGEAKFLPIIGEDHAAAMPYEMILQGNELTMLHGKYRIALYWPELTMGTFMKIMSTPGNIEDTLKELAY